MQALRCLVVEDEVITALSLRIELEQHGYVVVGSATTGQSAVEMAGSTSPDVVIMDIHLDGSIDGIQAAETIRDRWGIPVLFFTGFDIEPLQARLTAVSPLAVLGKPVRVAEIDRILKERMAGSESKAT